jgi:hypothetical protein
MEQIGPSGRVGGTWTTAPRRRSGAARTSGGWRASRECVRVAPRRRSLRALNAQRSLRFTHASYPQFPQHVGSNFWTANNSLKARLRPSPTLRASLSLRICAPTVPASSRSYGCRSRGASTCRQGVRGGCRVAWSDRIPAKRAERSHRRLACPKRQRGASPSVRNRSA